MPIRSPRLFGIAFLILVFWLVSGLPSGVFVAGGPPPVMSYMAFLGFVMLVVAIRTLQKQPLMRAEHWKVTRLIWAWLFTFVVWTTISYLISSQSAVATQRLINAIEMSLIFGGFILMLCYWQNAKPLGVALGLLVLMSGTLNIYDFFQPTFSKVPGRAAGLYENPTISGFIIVLTVTASLAFVRIPFRWLLLTIGAIGVFITFSRGSWVVLFISISWLFMKGYLGWRKQRVIIGLLAIGAIGILFYSILSGSLADLVLNSPLEKYLDSNTLARLGLTQFAADYSANERQNVALFAMEKFLNAPNPILGFGLGYTFEWDYDVSTHNMYLLFLVEGGIVGVTIYIALLAILWRNSVGIGRLLILQIAMFSFFSHNVLDSPSRIFFFALIATSALSMKKITRPKREKA